MADEELKKAFTELQVKMVETNQRVRVSEAQIQSLQRSITRAKLTDEEITALPDGTNLYKAVGRMFLLQPASEIKKELLKDKRNAEDKIKSIQEQIAYWEKSVKESEESIRDMLSHRREK